MLVLLTTPLPVVASGTSPFWLSASADGRGRREKEGLADGDSVGGVRKKDDSGYVR